MEQKSLTKYLPLFKVLTVIAFLFVCIPGEKISVFMFVILLLAPFDIINGLGSRSILFTGLDPLVSIPLDLIAFVFTLFSIYNLIWRRNPGGDQKKASLLHLFNVLIFYPWVVMSMINPYNDTFSLITVGIFVGISAITMVAILMVLTKAPREVT